MRYRFARRLFFALLAVMLWLGFVVDGSHALFSDSVRLVGNTLTTGTTNLLISNSQNPTSTVFDKERAGFAMALNPGESVGKFFLIKNANDGGVNFQLFLNSALASGDTSMPLYVTVTLQEVDHDGVGVGPTAQFNLENLMHNYLELPFVVQTGEVKRFQIITKLEGAYSTQNTSIAYALNFSGTQKL
jgi:hypothetical protein